MDPLIDPSAWPPTSMATVTAYSELTNPNSYRLNTPNPQQDYMNPHQPLSYQYQEQLPSSHPVGSDPSPLATTTSFFDDAYRTSPSPPPFNSTFLDSILNPIESHIFGLPLLNRPPRSLAQLAATPAMPPSRPARLPNGYVDLTSSPGDQSSSRHKRPNAASGPSPKRMKQNDGTAANFEGNNEANAMYEIDLSNEQARVQEVLQKQRQEAVKAQQRPEEKATTFNTINCVICMDTPTDLTATSCGHLFCHTCLMEALIAGENRSSPGEQKRSQCPVCRKFINRNKGNDIIPLLFRKGLATQPRRKASVAGATAKVTS